jgi:hypothetical protein
MNYKFGGRAKVCGVCEGTFDPGDRIVSAVHPEGEGFARRDVHEGCFKGKEEAFSFWYSTLPESSEQQQKLDLNLARDFLAKLIREADERRAGLVYTLTLLLSRKRRVKILETKRDRGAEVLSVLMPGDEEDETHTVPVPILDAAEVDRIQAEIELLFEGAKTSDPASN